MADPHTNFGYSTVATAPSPASSGTSLVVQAGDGAKFPSTGSFNATVWPASTQPTTANAEIVRVTAISTDTFTITRAQESTSARTIVVGDQIADTITAKTLTDVEVNVYVTDQNKTIPATTQVIFDDYLEVAASFFYELSTDAIVVIGDFATPLPAPDQNTNIFVTVANETVPSNSEVVFSDFYELSAPFTSEVAVNGLMQLGTNPSAPRATVSQITLTSGDLSISSTAFVNATGIVLTPIVGANRCLVIYSGAVDNSGAAYNCVDLSIDGVQQGQTFGLTFVRAANAAAGGGNLSFTYLTPVLSPGTHIFQILFRVTAGTGTFYASSTVPAFLSVVELTT